MDVLTYFGGPATDLAFRRGWTHGILALVLWPFVLTGVMVALDRGLSRARRASLPSGLVPREVFFLSSVAILSHPILDTLNTYGMRWLMPFSGRWFYGDTLFIVDPWLWLALGAGVALSRPGRGTRPARIALWFSFAYVAAMGASTLAARRITGLEIAAISGQAVERLMVSPFPVNPFVRSVVVEHEDVYRTARFHWLAHPHLDPASVRIFPKGRADHPAVQAAAATTVGRRYLGWARFPAFQVEPAGGGGDFVVRIVDLRYGDPPGAPIGSVSIPVTIRPASEPSPGTLPPS